MRFEKIIRKLAEKERRKQIRKTSYNKTDYKLDCKDRIKALYSRENLYYGVWEKSRNKDIENMISEANSLAIHTLSLSSTLNSNGINVTNVFLEKNPDDKGLNIPDSYIFCEGECVFEAEKLLFNPQLEKENLKIKYVGFDLKKPFCVIGLDDDNNHKRFRDVLAEVEKQSYPAPIGKNPKISLAVLEAKPTDYCEGIISIDIGERLVENFFVFNSAFIDLTDIYRKKYR